MRIKLMNDFAALVDTFVKIFITVVHPVKAAYQNWMWAP